MRSTTKAKRILFFAVLATFVVTGTYNALVINAESSMAADNVKFVKRLDEMYGVLEPGRQIAASLKWQKIPRPQAQQLKKTPKISTSRLPKKVSEAPSEVAHVTEAAVQETLNLGLAEVVNPKKWPQGLKQSQFSGSLATNSGIIESLNVDLPNGESLSVSFSDMKGNVFEYDFEGELYSGMMYQVDQHSYMVTLSTGPLEGTRLKFNSLPSEQMENWEGQRQELSSPSNDVAINDVAINDVAINDEVAQQQGMQESGQQVSYQFEQNQTEVSGNKEEIY
jgi:hypothetical protein